MDMEKIANALARILRVRSYVTEKTAFKTSQVAFLGRYETDDAHWGSFLQEILSVERHGWDLDVSKKFSVGEDGLTAHWRFVFRFDHPQAATTCLKLLNGLVPQPAKPTTQEPRRPKRGRPPKQAPPPPPEPEIGTQEDGSAIVEITEGVLPWTNTRDRNRPTDADRGRFPFPGKGAYRL